MLNQSLYNTRLPPVPTATRTPRKRARSRAVRCRPRASVNPCGVGGYGAQWTMSKSELTPQDVMQLKLVGDAPDAPDDSALGALAGGCSFGAPPSPLSRVSILRLPSGASLRQLLVASKYGWARPQRNTQRERVDTRPNIEHPMEGSRESGAEKQGASFCPAAGEWLLGCVEVLLHCTPRSRQSPIVLSKWRFTLGWGAGLRLQQGARPPVRGGHRGGPHPQVLQGVQQPVPGDVQGASDGGVHGGVEPPAPQGESTAHTLMSRRGLHRLRRHSDANERMLGLS
jgi:hypothetical protein